MSCKHTPDVAELLPVRQYRCEYCSDHVFGNLSHYQLHLRQRHKLTTVNNKQQGQGTTYHCPVDSCIYNAERKCGRGFTDLRLLRQHFQKTHMIKEHKCQECNETFLTARHLEKHQCSLVHQCSVCGLTYTSKASLQTHMRRKKHQAAPSLPSKVALSSLKSWRKTQKVVISAKTTNNESSTFKTIPQNNSNPSTIQLVQSAETPLQSSLFCLPTIEIPYGLQIPEQTENDVHMKDVKPVINENELPLPSFSDEEVERLLRDMETQTDEVDLDAADMTNEVLLRNMQTQTLDNRQHQSTMTELDLTEVETDTRSAYAEYQEEEPMFGPQTSAHMHTQTVDNRQHQGTMTELDLEAVTAAQDVNAARSDYAEYQEQEPIFGPQTSAHMHTQTLDNRQHQGTMTELDLEAVAGAQDVNATRSEYADYQEQEPMFGPQTSAHMHTQTCDELFEELGLSHIQTQTQWPDDGLYTTQHTQTCDEMLDELLENFQSTCTQTRWLDWQEAESTAE